MYLTAAQETSYQIFVCCNLIVLLLQEVVVTVDSFMLI